MEWWENNGLNDNNVFVRIDKVCACLGRDIIDRLGYSQSFGERNWGYNEKFLCQICQKKERTLSEYYELQRHNLHVS